MQSEQIRIEFPNAMPERGMINSGLPIGIAPVTAKTPRNEGKSSINNQSLKIIDHKIHFLLISSIPSKSSSSEIMISSLTFEAQAK